MPTHKIIIPGNPYPLKRPRFGKGRAYDHPDNKAMKALVSQVWRLQGAKQTIEVPVNVTCLFFFQWPIRTSKKRMTRSNGIYHDKRPDIDNLMKWVLDGLTEAGAWKDDALVARLYGEKVYMDREPCTHVSVTPLWDDEEEFS